MPQTLLGSLALSYLPLWGKTRELTGIRLALTSVPGGFVDAPHLLQVLRSFLPHKNASLIISPADPELLLTLLDLAPAYAPCIEVSSEMLEDPAVAALVRSAHTRGLHMVWRGPNDWAPASDLAACFHQYLLCMDEQDTVAALRAARSGTSSQNGADTLAPSPVQAGQMYEGVASRALADHCLDQRQAASVLGWPTDEVLQTYRNGAMQPGVRSLRLVINAAAADASLESMESLLGEDPVLAYRLLTHVNSAAMGLQKGVDSLRRALMMMGYSALKAWCTQQLPHANEDLDVNPIRTTNLLRANLAELLLDPGGEADMRGEIRLCGLFSQLDLLLGTPLPEALARIPIADRVVEAVCAGNGPYAPYLQLAMALESSNAALLPDLCNGFEMDLDDVNRALLRTLGAMPIKT